MFLWVEYSDVSMTTEFMYKEVNILIISVLF